MHRKKPHWLLFVSFLVFLLFLFLVYYTGEMDYLYDVLLVFFISLVLYFAYDALFLESWIYLLIIGAFSLHNLGVFGFYNVTPVGIQWDHITHIAGLFAAGVFVYNYVHAKGFLKDTKTQRSLILVFILLAGMGMGVFVEFLEFFGYFVVGDGLGVFGHGLGDINTEFINNEWFNTMLDLIYNFVGVALAIVFCRYILRDNYLRKPT